MKQNLTAIYCSRVRGSRLISDGEEGNGRDQLSRHDHQPLRLKPEIFDERHNLKD
jgi:hypothetical protein